MAARERALVQRQAGQASSAEEEEARLVRQAQDLDAQRAEFQALLAEAKQGMSHLKSRILACTGTPDAHRERACCLVQTFLTSSCSSSVSTQHALQARGNRRNNGAGLKQPQYLLIPGQPGITLGFSLMTPKGVLFPFLSFPFLSFPFLSFPFLSFPFLFFSQHSMECSMAAA